MALKGRKTSNKNPPVLSHEFIIQNHADIVSCIAMLFIIGLMIQVTSPIAYMFLAVQHNATVVVQSITNEPMDITLYTYGWKDLCSIFFYSLICIVMHAVFQEYLLDKVTRKLHLSKVKQSKFNESGQLAIFYVFASLWGLDIIIRGNHISNIATLWENYPHDKMAFSVKFYFIIQLAYWIHCYPELYFQKVKKEDMLSRIQQPTITLCFITVGYLLNFTRVGFVLLVLHYISEMLFHIARLAYFLDKSENGNKGGYFIANVVFVFVRLFSIILSVLTFWYGLPFNEKQEFSIETGNFNTPYIRISTLLVLCSLQAWIMWNFITFHMKKWRERTSSQTTAAARKPKVEKRVVPKKKKDEAKDKRTAEDDELPEVDQNTKKSLRSRNPKAK